MTNSTPAEPRNRKLVPEAIGKPVANFAVGNRHVRLCEPGRQALSNAEGLSFSPLRFAMPLAPPSEKNAAWNYCFTIGMGSRAFQNAGASLPGDDPEYVQEGMST